MAPNIPASLISGKTVSLSLDSNISAVLFLEEDEPGRPAYAAMMIGFRRTLEQSFPGMVAIYPENLDLARFSNPDYRDQSGRWLRQKYRGKQINVIIASGPTSMELAKKFREEFWPDARIVGISGAGGNQPDGERELQKFGLAPCPLPEGAELHFAPPSLWETHRNAVLVGGTFVVGQSALIIALIIQLRRRRRAEQKVHAQRDQLAHVGRVSSLGQLAASIAHELNQPLGAILRNAGAAERLLQNADPDIPELRAIIDDIRADDNRASSVIERMRALPTRHSLEFAPVDPNALLHQVAALLGFSWMMTPPSAGVLHAC